MKLGGSTVLFVVVLCYTAKNANANVFQFISNFVSSSNSSPENSSDTVSTPDLKSIRKNRNKKESKRVLKLKRPFRANVFRYGTLPPKTQESRNLTSTYYSNLISPTTSFNHPVTFSFKLPTTSTFNPPTNSFSLRTISSFSRPITSLVRPTTVPFHRKTNSATPQVTSTHSKTHQTIHFSRPELFSFIRKKSSTRPTISSFVRSKLPFSGSAATFFSRSASLFFSPRTASFIRSTAYFDQPSTTLSRPAVTTNRSTNTFRTRKTYSFGRSTIYNSLSSSKNSNSLSSAISPSFQNPSITSLHTKSRKISSNTSKQPQTTQILLSTFTLRPRLSSALPVKYPRSKSLYLSISSPSIVQPILYSSLSLSSSSLIPSLTTRTASSIASSVSYVIINRQNSQSIIPAPHPTLKTVLVSPTKVLSSKFRTVKPYRSKYELRYIADKPKLKESISFSNKNSAKTKKQFSNLPSVHFKKPNKAAVENISNLISEIANSISHKGKSNSNLSNWHVSHSISTSVSTISDSKSSKPLSESKKFTKSFMKNHKSNITSHTRNLGSENKELSPPNLKASNHDNKSKLSSIISSYSIVPQLPQLLSSKNKINKKFKNSTKISRLKNTIRTHSEPNISIHTSSTFNSFTNIPLNNFQTTITQTTTLNDRSIPVKYSNVSSFAQSSNDFNFYESTTPSKFSINNFKSYEGSFTTDLNFSKNKSLNFNFIPSLPTFTTVSTSPISHHSSPVAQKVNIRKCCGVGEAFLMSLGRCHTYHIEFIVPVYFNYLDKYKNISVEQMNVVPGTLKSCEPSILNEGEFILFDTGILFSEEYEDYFYPENYCLENIVNDDVQVQYLLTAAICPIVDIPESFDQYKTPVRKCCPVDLVVAQNSFECTAPGTFNDLHDWEVPIYTDEFSKFLVSAQSEEFRSNFDLVSGYPECVLSERGTVLDFSWSYQVSHESGQLNIPSLGTHTKNYCIDKRKTNSNETKSFAYLCLSNREHADSIIHKPDCDLEQNCIRKCCPYSQILDDLGNCVSSYGLQVENANLIRQYKIQNKELFDGYINLEPAPIHYENGTKIEISSEGLVEISSPNCGERGMFITGYNEKAIVLVNGSVKYTSYDPNECGANVDHFIKRDDFCFEWVSHITESGYFEIKPGALLCYPEHKENIKPFTNYVYTFFLVISDAFILASCVVYLTIPDQTKRGLNKNVKLGHSVLGRIILSFLFSLFFAYLCLIIVNNGSDAINMASKKACVSLGIVMYIAFLSTFFWLNILCFELWWKCTRNTRTSGCRMVWYQLYGWGSPILIGAITLYIEFTPAFGPCFVKPNFGLHTCFFSETRTFGSLAKWVYLNGPLAILLTSDLVFFGLTVKSLARTVNQKHNVSVRRQSKQRLKLCFKLFLVMGISWLCEIISSLGSQKWFLAEIFNCLQGFIIFSIFILKPKITHAIHEKLKSIFCRKNYEDNTRQKLTFTASILSDFLSSKRRSHPPFSPQNLSSSTVSTNLNSSSYKSADIKTFGHI